MSPLKTVTLSLAMFLWVAPIVAQPEHEATPDGARRAAAEHEAAQRDARRAAAAHEAAQQDARRAIAEHETAVDEARRHLETAEDVRFRYFGAMSKYMEDQIRWESTLRRAAEIVERGAIEMLEMLIRCAETGADEYCFHVHTADDAVVRDGARDRQTVRDSQTVLEDLLELQRQLTVAANDAMEEANRLGDSAREVVELANRLGVTAESAVARANKLAVDLQATAGPPVTVTQVVTMQDAEAAILAYLRAYTEHKAAEDEARNAVDRYEAARSDVRNAAARYTEEYAKVEQARVQRRAAGTERKALRDRSGNPLAAWDAALDRSREAAVDFRIAWGEYEAAHGEAARAVDRCNGIGPREVCLQADRELDHADDLLTRIRDRRERFIQLETEIHYASTRSNEFSVADRDAIARQVEASLAVRDVLVTANQFGLLASEARAQAIRFGNAAHDAQMQVNRLSVSLKAAEAELRANGEDAVKQANKLIADLDAERVTVDVAAEARLAALRQDVENLETVRNLLLFTMGIELVSSGMTTSIPGAAGEIGAQIGATLAGTDVYDIAANTLETLNKVIRLKQADIERLNSEP